MHRDAYPYLGTRVGGQLYVMTRLPFGIASACRIYTQVMAAVYRPVRQQGQQLSYIIDDALGVAQGHLQGRYQIRTLLMLFTALGLTPSMHKCSVEPGHAVVFRGLQLDSLQGLCTVPGEKLQYFQQLAQPMLDRGRATTRELASAAGVLASFQPGMFYAMMQARAYYEAGEGLPCDGTVVQLSAEAREEMQFWLEQMPGANGRPLWGASPSTILASDASDTAYAAYVVKGQPQRFVFQLDLTRLQRSQVQSHELGSTLRELGAITHCLRALLRHRSGHITNSRLLWLSDSKSAVANLVRMRGGTPEILQEVRQICWMAVQNSISVDWQWRPRDEPEQAQADYYTKESDTGGWTVR